MNILLIGGKQYGYYTPYYSCCLHCPKDVYITYLGVNTGLPIVKPSSDNVRVLEIKSSYNSRPTRLYARIRFNIQCIKEILLGKYDVVCVLHYTGVFLLGLVAFLRGRRIMLDITTGALHSTARKRKRKNQMIYLETFFFPRVSILSLNLAQRLKLNKKKTYHFPLGGEILDMPERSYDHLNLLYLGAVCKMRQIERTIQGLALFVKRHPEIPVFYDIVGPIRLGEESFYQKEIENPVIKDNVALRGYVHHKDMYPYWRKANIGVSFIPMNESYDLQPPTKTYEYIGAGIPVIATATTENKEIVNDDNGILCQNTPESFADALEQFWMHRHEYHLKKIQSTIKNSTWEVVVFNLFQYFRVWAVKK